MVLNKLLQLGSKYKVITKYLSSSFMSLPVSLLVGFLVFRKIDPYFMGIWATVAIFETYFTILRLGVVNGMNRELPFALGQGKTKDAVEFAQTALSYTILTILLIVVLIPFMVLKLELEKAYLAAIGVFSVKVILSFYNTYLTGTFRSNDHFNKLSNIQFFLLTTKLFSLPLILLGFYGYLGMELFIIVVHSALLHRFRPFRIKPRFIKQAFKKLFKIGFPVFLVSYAVTFTDTLPRLFILSFGDEYMMGLYAPVIMMLGAVSLFPNTLITYMYPKFSFKLGQNQNTQQIWKTLVKIYLFSIVFISIFAVLIFFLLDFFIVLFPKYKESLPYIRLALLICPFVVYRIGNTINVVYKKYNYMIAYAVLYALVQVGSIFVLSNIYSDILKIAIVSQIITYASLLLFSIYMNFLLIRKQ
jgi:O-antigen/teichoic acid export membrane protein